MASKNFNQLFDEWAPQYDQTVYDHDGEYHEVFEGYDDILNAVVNHLPEDARLILEFGVGTGNLSQKLIDQGYQVTGIEPSAQMRRQVGLKKIPLDLREGDFLNFSLDRGVKVDAIVSSFAFHHLPLDDKRESIKRMKKVLKPAGMIVFADTCYENEQTKQALLDRVERQGYRHLLHDLKTEFYEFHRDLRNIFEQEGFQIEFKPMNRFVWLMVCRG